MHLIYTRALPAQWGETGLRVIPKSRALVHCNQDLHAHALTFSAMLACDGQLGQQRRHLNLVGHPCATAAIAARAPKIPNANTVDAVPWRPLRLRAGVLANAPELQTTAQKTCGRDCATTSSCPRGAPTDNTTTTAAHHHHLTRMKTDNLNTGVYENQTTMGRSRI